MSTETTEAMLDRARTGKEIGILTALALIQSDGDAAAALFLLAGMRDVAKPESDEELDAVSLAEQAIREACAMQGRSV